MNTTTNTTMKAIENASGWTVKDTDGGGLWWPNAEALVEIEASNAPEQVAIAICRDEPMRGRWSA